MSERDKSGEPSDWFEKWLWEIAGGKRVRTLPLLLGWAALIAIVAAIVYLAGGRTQPSFLIPIALVSGAYWMFAVPAYVKVRYRDR